MSRTAPDLRAWTGWRPTSPTPTGGGGVADLESVDAVVHCAGFQRTNPLGSLRAEDLRAMFDVHVAAAALLVDALADRIVDGGRVVLIGSRTMVGVAGKSQYAATRLRSRGCRAAGRRNSPRAGSR